MLHASHAMASTRESKNMHGETTSVHYVQSGLTTWRARPASPELFLAVRCCASVPWRGEREARGREIRSENLHEQPEYYNDFQHVCENYTRAKINGIILTLYAVFMKFCGLM